MAVSDPRELVSDVERLLGEVEALPDPAARETATAVAQALLELYGTGLERIVETIAARDDGELASALAGDELVSHLLLLHGLHPMPLRDRVVEALGEVRPYLESHGGNVELLAVEGSSVHLRLEGSCSGCPSSAMTLKLAIENAIHKLAPEIEDVIAQDAAPPSPPLLQIEVAGVPAGPAAHETEVSWTMAGGLPELAGGGQVVKDVAGQSTLFLKLGERFYAYLPSCPACGDSLEQARLRGTELECAGCGNRYDVLRAGRCFDSPALHLEPVPLLVNGDGLIKIALAAAA